MDLREQLLLEHSKANTLKIATYIGNDKKRFEELLKLFFADEYRTTQRAAMAISACFDLQPNLFEPYIPVLIENLTQKEELHVAVKRNTVRFLQFCLIPEDYESILFDCCLSYLTDVEETVAVKAFSMTVLYRICQKYPDLKQELIPVIEDNLAYSDKAGLQNRGKKILKKLNQL